MEIWETIKTVSREFDMFFEAIPKKDRLLLSKLSSREYDGYIKKNFTGTL